MQINPQSKREEDLLVRRAKHRNSKSTNFVQGGTGFRTKSRHSYSRATAAKVKDSPARMRTRAEPKQTNKPRELGCQPHGQHEAESDLTHAPHHSGFPAYGRSVSRLRREVYTNATATPTPRKTTPPEAANTNRDS